MLARNSSIHDNKNQVYGQQRDSNNTNRKSS